MGSSPARLVIALSVAAALAIFVVYTALAGNGVAPPFAFWGGDFWFFQEDNSVVRYKYATDKSFTTVVPPSQGTSPFGAGVSTCAPIVPPN